MNYSEEHNLSERWSVRKHIWDQLLTHLVEGSSIYIWGSSGTGKTLIIKDALFFTSISNVYLNCLEYFSFKSIFKKLKSEITHDLSLNAGNTKNPHKFSLSIAPFRFPYPYYVVLDKAQKLLAIDALLVSRLQELSSLSGFKFSFIVITDTYNESLFIHPYTIDRGFSPVRIHLPEYNLNELSKILRKKHSYGSDQEFTKFFDIISKVLVPYTSTIFHYDSVFDKSYEIFLNVENFCSIDTTLAIIMRELTNVESVLFQKFRCCRDYAPGLSLKSKVLIIAGFICSKESSRFDAVLLKGKRKNGHKVKEDYADQSPKKFSLQRIKSVYSILLHLVKGCSSKYVPSSQLERESFCSLFNTLIEKNVFVAIDDKEPLGCEKFMCTVEFDFCDSIAETLGIRLREFVFDIVE